MGVNEVKATSESDIVYTPDGIAEYMIEYFMPIGRILDPCSGEGAFLRHLPKDTESCEILDGKDFFNWHEHVDYIISNPPYSIFSDFLRHSFEVADNIVYLIPANKIFNSHRLMREIREYGGVREIHVIAQGSRLKFPIGFCIAAVHFQRGYKGETRISYMDNGL